MQNHTSQHGLSAQAPAPSVTTIIPQVTRFQRGQKNTQNTEHVCIKHSKFQLDYIHNQSLKHSLKK